MKKIIISIPIFFLLLVSACTNLDENPKNFISPENSYGEIGIFESMLTACYSKFGDSYSDNVWITGGDQATADNLDFTRYNVSTSNGTIYGLWKVNYDMINNLNSILNNIDQVVDPNKDEVDLIIGQAHFLRAIGYFYLVRYFGDIPLLTEGVKSFTEANNFMRESQTKVYDVIISDLQKAEELLSDAGGEPGRASKYAAKAVLAKVYLTMAGAPLKQADKYALAATKAKEIIDSKQFDLGENYIDAFKPVNQTTSKSIIFQVVRIAGMGSDFYNGLYKHFSFLGVGTDVVSNPGLRINVNFIDQYPDGPRKEALFYMTDHPNVADWIEGATDAPELNEDRKYFILPVDYLGFSSKYSWIGAEEGKSTSQESDQNYVVFRYAEILMIYAEAQARADGTANADAYAAVNAVRKRAYGEEMALKASLSNQDFIDAVILERHYELAFEAKRWFDVVRLELSMKYEIYGLSDDLSPDVRDAPYPDRYLMPIPMREIELNPKLTQNEGY